MVVARRHGRRGGPADHARVRQGDDGRPVARGGHGRRAQACPSATRSPRARLILTLEAARRRRTAAPAATARGRAAAVGRRRRRSRARPTTTPTSSCSAPGPGGYTAAFRAADLGLKVILIERYERLGGVCLNVGCIPSKALLHVARVIAEAEEAKGQGISFGEPEIDLDGLRGWKESVVGRLTGGLDGLAKQRKVDGRARRRASSRRRTSCASRASRAPRPSSFDRCIIAAGSSAIRLPGVPPTTRGSWTRPARSSSRTSRTGCSSSAAGSSASRWRRSTTRSARPSRSSSSWTSSSPAPTRTSSGRCRSASPAATRRSTSRRRSRRSRRPTTACG